MAFRFLSRTVHRASRRALPATLAVLCAVLMALLVGPLAALAALEFPALTGRIVDNANLISLEDKGQLEAELAAIEEKSTDQVAILTTPSLGGTSIEDYGYQLGRTWGIGQKGKDNGVILIVAPNDRKVRIEVGRGLEPVMTDLMSKIIIENAILPKFRQGDFSGGIRDGIRDIRDVLMGDAEAVKERARGRAGGEVDWLTVALILLWLAIFAYVMWAQIKHGQQSPQPLDNRRRRNRQGPIIVTGDWSGGGWGGGGGGGGGWSGGGGGFGGGGSSGGW